MDFNDYVGLPYSKGGRDRTGIDCWGLVRLVHAEQFGNALPSFADAYDLATERDRLADLIAQQKEAWQPVDSTEVGDVIVLRIEGAESHLGVIVAPGMMLHAMAGSGSVIEPYASAKWLHRISGYFRYAPHAPVTISAKPHPLRSTRIDDTLPHGASVQMMVDHYTRACGWPSDVPVRGVAFVDGLPVAQAEWAACVPAPGSRVEFRVVAGSGNVGRLVAMIAVTVFAAWAAPYLVGGMAGINGAAVLGSTGLAVATGVVQGALVVAGAMLVNAIFPIRPPESGGMAAIKPAWALSGGQNQMSPYGALPVVLGQYRFTGLLATQPWLEQAGDETYMRQTVVWGYGPLQVSDIKCGDTPLGSLEEVTSVTTDGAGPIPDEFWALTDNDVTYLPINLALPSTLDQEADWIERTTAGEVDRITALLSWPQGLGMTSSRSGNNYSMQSTIYLQARLVGSGTWDHAIQIFVQGYINKAFNNSMDLYVPRGQYDVRVRRLSTYAGDPAPDGIEDRYVRRTAVTCVGLRTHAYTQAITPPQPLAMTALRVRASNQINGQLDGVSALVQSICLDWTGSAWVAAATRNPASLYRYVLQHPGNARAVSDSQIDLAALQDWHAWCAARGLIFDHVLTGRRPLLDVLRDICAAGRASPGMIDGKWTVTIDREKPTIAQHFTPHNSWGFEGVRLLPTVPHALRVNFVNAAVDYQPDERIVYDDGYSAANATEIESIELPGVSSADAVYKLARHHLAQIKLRPEEYALHADIEHIVCNRGDRVRVTHDVPMWGIGSGRIKTRIDAAHIEIDEPLPMEAGTTYTVRIRMEDGTSITRTVAAAATSDYHTTLTLTTSITATEGQPGNLVMFGALNAESVDCLVKSIEPGDNCTARLVLVDYAPGVFTADTQSIPEWSSRITRPPVLARSRIAEVPLVTSVISDERALIRIGPRTFQANIKVSWAQPGTLSTQQVGVETQIRQVGDSVGMPWEPYGVAPLTDGGILIGPALEGAQYDIRVRYVSTEKYVSEWAMAATAHTVVGKSSLPPSVEQFKVIEQGGIKQYVWKLDDPPIDLLAFEIAYCLGATELPWEEMIPLASTGPIARGHDSTEPINAGEYTFAVRTVDADETPGEPVYYTVTLGSALLGLPDAVINMHELGWPGTKTNCYVEGTTLVDDGSVTWGDMTASWSATTAAWANAASQTISYEHPPYDIGSLSMWSIRATTLLGGSQTVEVATSEDGTTYTAWAAVDANPVSCRYVKFRMSVSGAYPIIYRASLLIYG